MLMNTERKFVTKKDILLIAAAVIVCLLLFAVKYAVSRSTSCTAVIYKNGEIYRTVDLSEVKTSYTIDLHTDPDAVLLVEPGAISYKTAKCRDKICVKTGKLTRPGQAASCLPSKTTVIIKGSSGTNTPDAIS